MGDQSNNGNGTRPPGSPDSVVTPIGKAQPELDFIAAVEQRAAQMDGRPGGPAGRRDRGGSGRIFAAFIGILIIAVVLASAFVLWNRDGELWTEAKNWVETVLPSDSTDDPGLAEAADQNVGTTDLGAGTDDSQDMVAMSEDDIDATAIEPLATTTSDETATSDDSAGVLLDLDGGMAATGDVADQATGDETTIVESVSTDGADEIEATALEPVTDTAAAEETAAAEAAAAEAQAAEAAAAQAAEAQAAEAAAAQAAEAQAAEAAAAQAAEAQAAEAAAAQAAEVTAAQEAAAAQTATAAAAEAAAIQAAEAAEAAAVAATEAAAAQAAAEEAAAAQTAAEEAAAAQAASAATETAAVEAPQVALVPIKLASSHSGVRAQLADYVSAQEAQEGWQKMKPSLGGILGGYVPVIEESDIGTGRSYRLQIGYFDSAFAALGFCNEALDRGVNCILVPE